MIPTRKFAAQFSTSPFQGEVWAVILCFLVTACSADVKPVFHADENPESLSDWGMVFEGDGHLFVNEGVLPYDLATPLFSDYALKLRTLWTPDGKTVSYDPDGPFDFPVGTVVTKTFYYPRENDEWDGVVTIGEAPRLSQMSLPLSKFQLVETRLLVRREAKWDALAYVWNEEQTDAVLKRTGDIKPMTLVRDDDEREAFAYLVPNVNQCAACHATNATTKEIQPIGLKASHLNKRSNYSHGLNQLDHWIAAGLLTGDFSNAGAAPKNADWQDETASLDARARAYLDINCSHCHNPVGPADTSGLNLKPDASGPALGRCKSPIAAGGGTGGRPYGLTPGAPEQSITLFRMETTDPGAMMPELGRAVAHDEGVALIAEWITEMEGACG
ncbi:MAG: hypothetical protein HKN14_03260 [Marinicaulis sp.]|nr:hypothetical protein [Marinicaulis sp.]